MKGEQCWESEEIKVELNNGLKIILSPNETQDLIDLLTNLLMQWQAKEHGY